MVHRFDKTVKTKKQYTSDLVYNNFNYNKFSVTNKEFH